VKKVAQLIIFLVVTFVFSLSDANSNYLSNRSTVIAQSNREDIENSVREIEKRKEEMRTESENLMKEKERLEEDYKREGYLMPIRKRREFEKRSSELEEKIKKFNEELEKMNQEETRLLNELNPM